MGDHGASPQKKKSLSAYVNGKRNQGPYGKTRIGGSHTLQQSVSPLCPPCGGEALPCPPVPETDLSHRCRRLCSCLSIVDSAAEMPALQKDFYGLSALSPYATNSSSARPCSTRPRTSLEPTNPTGKRFDPGGGPSCMTTGRTTLWRNEAPRSPTAASGVGSRGWGA